MDISKGKWCCKCGSWSYRQYDKTAYEYIMDFIEKNACHKECSNNKKEMNIGGDPINGLIEKNIR